MHRHKLYDRLTELHSRALTLARANTRSLTHTYTSSFTHTYALAPSLTHTHAHTHVRTHTRLTRRRSTHILCLRARRRRRRLLRLCDACDASTFARTHTDTHNKGAIGTGRRELGGVVRSRSTAASDVVPCVPFSDVDGARWGRRQLLLLLLRTTTETGVRVRACVRVSSSVAAMGGAVEAVLRGWRAARPRPSRARAPEINKLSEVGLLLLLLLFHPGLSATA